MAQSFGYTGILLGYLHEDHMESRRPLWHEDGYHLPGCIIKAFASGIWYGDMPHLQDTAADRDTMLPVWRKGTITHRLTYPVWPPLPKKLSYQIFPYYLRI